MFCDGNNTRGGVALRCFHISLACPAIACSIRFGSMPIYRCVMAELLCCKSRWSSKVRIIYVLYTFDGKGGAKKEEQPFAVPPESP